MSDTLIDVRNLKTYFPTDEGVVKAVDDVSLVIPRGKTLGLVGESGCGKSVTAMSIIRLISPPGRIYGGSITMQSRGVSLPLEKISEPELCKIRGSRISMIFQEPMTSLNPVFTIGQQIAEAIRLHQGVDKPTARQRAIEMLRKVHAKFPCPSGEST